MLLSLLARRSGEVLSRTLIAELVWDINFDTDTNVVKAEIAHAQRMGVSGVPFFIIDHQYAVTGVQPA